MHVKTESVLYTVEVFKYRNLSKFVFRLRVHITGLSARIVAPVSLFQSNPPVVSRYSNRQ